MAETFSRESQGGGGVLTPDPPPLGSATHELVRKSVEIDSVFSKITTSSMVRSHFWVLDDQCVRPCKFHSIPYKCIVRQP